MTSTSDTGTGQSIHWIFDAEGQRAQKSISGGSWTLYIHDAFGQLAAEYNNQGISPSCVTCYLSYDMLGSVRMVTDQSQNLIARHDYVPFGEEIPNGSAGRVGNFGYPSDVTQGFTGQESDGGTAQLDFFNARHLAAVTGAFVQPDPGNAGADVMNPQSWNGYGYVLGNPLDATDPSGLTECTAQNNFCELPGVSNTSNAGAVPSPFPGNFGSVGLQNFTDPFDVLELILRQTLTYASQQSATFTPEGGSSQLLTFPVLPGSSSFDVSLLAGVIGSSTSSGQSKPTSPTNPNLPTPTIFPVTIPGTHYCGPGGKGTPTNRTDAACAGHDRCYEDAHLSFWNNAGLPNTPSEASAIRACDAALANSLRHIYFPTRAEAGQATIVSTFFNLPSGYNLRP